MGTLRQIVAADTRIFDNPKDPANSGYVLVVPNTIADAVYLQNGQTLAEFLLTLTEDCEANKERLNGHIGRGGVDRHPLGNGMTAGFTEQNYTDSRDQTLDASFVMATIAGISENDDVVTRTGRVTAASGTVVFKTPFDIIPEVFIPLGGTPANVTKTGFTYSGSAANRAWVAIADNS